MPLDGAAPRLRYPGYEEAKVFASELEILDQVKSVISTWRLNREQRKVLKAVLAHRRVVVLKGRQVGISTLLCLVDLLVAIMNPGISVLIMAHTHDATMELAAKVKAWVEALEIPTVRQTEKLIGLHNKSRIVFRTARSPGGIGRGVATTGRASSYHHIHLSEAAFFANDYATIASLLTTASPLCRLVVESTAAPSMNYFQRLWKGIDMKGKPVVDSWKRVWLSTEMHEAYRAANDDIDDATWQAAQAEFGFKDRAFAAWWLQKLRDDIHDVNQMLREYPVLPEQAFTFAEGRWIFGSKLVSTTKQGHWHRYIHEVEPCIFAVDVASGDGRDYSVIAVIGRRSRKLHAIWMANTVDVATFQEHIVASANVFKPETILIEGNGIGKGPLAHVRRTGHVVHEHTAGDHEKPARMALLKYAIESGDFPIGPEVHEELESSVVIPRPGKSPKYEGRDDALSASSIGLAWLRANPVRVSRRAQAANRNIYVPRAPKRRSKV